MALFIYFIMTANSHFPACWIGPRGPTKLSLQISNLVSYDFLCWR